ncbi:MAG: hypothetical protein Q8L53_16715 [Aestuariivirga sp.]|nr:hypothetical protein [Aestuariivirga sp.]
MTPKCDRRDILSLVGPHFPSLPAGITSDELHGFLDAQTGLETALDEPNGVAFDRWRQALAEQGIPVWGISPERAAAIKARGAELKAAEDRRVAELPAKLAELAKTAPLVSAKELLKP